MNGFKEETLSFDYAVIGGGLTGLCSALAAARHGAKTVLIQDRPVLGGNASSEIRMHVVGASANQHKPYLNEGGILHEIQLTNKSINDSFNFSIWDAVLFNAAKTQKNLTLLLNTTMYSAEASDSTVRCVHCYQMTTEKNFTIKAEIFADCTGNGTLSAFVGNTFRTGSEGREEFNEPHAPEKEDRHRMGNTLLFKARDTGHPVKFVPPVETIHFSEEDLKFRKHSSEFPKELKNSEGQSIMDMQFGGFCQDYGYWWIEVQGNEENDIISEFEDIRDTLVKAVYGIWDHIKNENDHGAANYELEWVGMYPGVRESRRIEGDYLLNENDVLSNRVFEDAVAYGGWWIDEHNPGGLFAYNDLPSFTYEFDGAYTIPYRSYLAKDFTNLYIGGRCLSATKLGMGTSRVMGTCAIGGQAFGTAAAMALSEKCPIRSIDISELQQNLLKDDCFIPGYLNKDEKDLARRALITASSEMKGFEANNVINGISREYDGNSNQWRSSDSAENQWLKVSLDKTSEISLVQFTFDSNFNIEKKITLSSKRQKAQEPGVPKELIKDFRVELIKDGKVVESKTVENNCQRLVRVNFDEVECDSVILRVLSTNGVSEARVFEVRVYAS